MGEVIHFSRVVLESPKTTETSFKPSLATLKAKLEALKKDYQTPHFKGHDNQAILKRVQHLTLLGQLESALFILKRIEVELQDTSQQTSPTGPINRINHLEAFFTQAGFEQNQIGAEILTELQELKPRALILPLEAELADLAASNHINERIIDKIRKMILELEQANLVDIPHQKTKEIMAQAAKNQLDKAILELQESPFLAIRDFTIQALVVAQECGVDTSEAEALIESIFPKADYDRESKIPDIKDRVEVARLRIRRQKEA